MDKSADAIEFCLPGLLGIQLEQLLAAIFNRNTAAKVIMLCRYNGTPTKALCISGSSRTTNSVPMADSMAKFARFFRSLDNGRADSEQ